MMRRPPRSTQSRSSAASDVYKRQSLFDPALRAAVIQGMADPQDARLASLTPQERKVLDLIGEGLTNRDIAKAMFLAEKTVKNYVSSMLAKLDFQRRTQAAVYVVTQRGGH